MEAIPNLDVTSILDKKFHHFNPMIFDRIIDGSPSMVVLIIDICTSVQDCLNELQFLITVKPDGMMKDGVNVRLRTAIREFPFEICYIFFLPYGLAILSREMNIIKCMLYIYI